MAGKYQPVPTMPLQQIAVSPLVTLPAKLANKGGDPGARSKQTAQVGLDWISTLR